MRMSCESMRWHIGGGTHVALDDIHSGFMYLCLPHYNYPHWYWVSVQSWRIEQVLRAIQMYIGDPYVAGTRTSDTDRTSSRYCPGTSITIHRPLFNYPLSALRTYRYTIPVSPNCDGTTEFRKSTFKTDGRESSRVLLMSTSCNSQVIINVNWSVSSDFHNRIHGFRLAIDEGVYGRTSQMQSPLNTSTQRKIRNRQKV